MHTGFSNSLKHGPLLLILVLAAVAAAGYLLARTRLPLYVRFAVLFSGLVAPLAITAHTETFELLPQVGRLHLEAEMGVCLLLGSIAWALYSLIPRWVRPIVLAICIAPVFLQWQNYTSRAEIDIQPADLAKHSEYTTARWLDAHMDGRRVYAGGSTSFWLNSFTDTPQLIGCCDQGLAMPVLGYLPYIVNSRVSPQDTVKAKPWLQALGVQALVVNGAASTDEYKDIQAPERYQGIFPVLHEENGDTIYSVLPEGSSLAHVMRPGEPVPVRLPGQRTADSDVARYAEAVGDSTRPPADFQWIHGGAARVRANLRQDDLLSVQVAFFSGWKADVGGARKPVSADGLGFVLIQPQCQGDCEITLRWTGSPDYLLAAAVSLISLMCVLAMVAAPGLHRTGASFPTGFSSRS